MYNKRFLAILGLTVRGQRIKAITEAIYRVYFQGGKSVEKVEAAPPIAT